MLLGYNTNGFAHHTLADAFAILSSLGYDAIAITLERQQIAPPDPRGVGDCVRRIAPLLESTVLTPTIETGARFILDPWRKHQPTLISADQDHVLMRIKFLQAAIDVAAEVGAVCVSLWSGTADDDADDGVLWDRLLRSMEPLLRHAEKRGVRLAFEPEPGMFIDRMDRFAELIERMPHASLGLTIDVGHLMCLDDAKLDDHVARWRARLWNVHIEDMRHGAHEHLMFGDGEIDTSAALRTLSRCEYTGPVHVELSRHSHMAVNAARRSLEYLRAALQS